MTMLSDISTRDELATLLGIKVSTLTYVLYKAKVDSFYTSFEIPKKSGGRRQIDAPTGTLKFIQERIAFILRKHLAALQSSQNTRTSISHAFERGKSIITNARIHRNKYIVLNFDLEHFFDSFHFGRVAGYFEKNRAFHLQHNIAIMIAQLTCYKGHLPQGAPSSPIITNLICQILDMHILKIAQKYRLDYTRYADDLTFSTNDRSFREKNDQFIDELNNEIVQSGFSINQKKTRISLRDSQQVVTGLVVNQKINVKAEYRRMTRAMAHQLYTTGSFQIDGQVGTLSQLEGRFSFISQLDKYDNLLNGNKRNFYKLNGNERQYRAFMFYKLFYINDKPLIVTEGKTDILYLKAALRSLWKHYPELITKDSNGIFHYKIAFLRKTKKLKYLMGIQQDGADTMKNIYNYFCDNNNDKIPNYYAFFSKMRPSINQQPVVFLFDNEMKTDRPISKFLSHIKADESKKNELSMNYFMHLISSTNLYLLTNNLVDGMQECEIEFLFDSATRAHKIGGRELCLKDKYDKKIYYGKNEFSRFISQNYAQIDFCRFKPLLDTLLKIVTTHSRIEIT